MRGRLKSLVIATCLVVLASCGGSSSAPRQRNAALSGATSAPTITGIIPGDGTLIVHAALEGAEPANTWFYQVATSDTAAANPFANGTWNTQGAPENFVLSGLTNGATYTVRVANWNGQVSDYASATATVGVNAPPSTIATAVQQTTTSTVPAPTCASGGDCALGDTGPGGGIVFFDAGSTKPWGRYLEYAPNDITDTAFGCFGSTNDAASIDIGGGKANTSEISQNPCGVGSAAAAASSLSSGGKSDWYLPSKSELNELCKFAHNQLTGAVTVPCNSNGTLRAGFSETFYWSSSEVSNELSWYQNFLTGEQYSYGKPAVASLRPIRAFNNVGGSTVTIAPLVPKCKRGGPCQVGDVGPGGGVVFYAAATPQTWGQYMEITTSPVVSYPNSWGCNTTEVTGTGMGMGTGLPNTVLLANKGCDAARFANDFVGANNTDDWFLPSGDELLAAAKAGKLTNRGWSSSVSGKCDIYSFGTYCWSYSVDPAGGGSIGTSGRTSGANYTFAVRAFTSTKAG